MRCLKSLAQTHDTPCFEVVVVDDGSKEHPPSELEKGIASFRTKLVRQVPLGVSAARNRGIAESKADMILFIDSDCTLDRHCLTELTKAVLTYHDDIAFQLRIVGDNRTQVGSMENLRVGAVQQSLLTESGHIKYINTSAFAIRRSGIDNVEFFDLGVTRGEDSLILLKLAEKGKFPRYVPEAVVQHAPVLSLTRYILKHFWIGYHTSPARQRIHRQGGILMTTPKRLKMLVALREMAVTEPTSQLSFFLVLVAYFLELMGRSAYALCGIRPGRTKVLSTAVDPVTKQEFQARIVSNAEQRNGMFITYLTAWTLVRSERDTEFRELLSSADLCYADGMGVVLALLFTKLRRMKKVTANDFFWTLFEELSYRKLKVALVGGENGLTEVVASRIKKRIPFLDVCLCASGYFSNDEEKHIVGEIHRTDPHIVILAMGQPLQESVAYRWRQRLPNMVFYCVGGLFDMISGKTIFAPGWVRWCGLEWIWRLVDSPRRLWRRYLFGLPLLGMYILSYDIVSFLKRFRMTSSKLKHARTVTKLRE